MAGAMGKARHKSSRRFIQLYTNVKRSEAYHSLSLPARCALIELMDRYTGINNGMISMSVRELAERLNCHHATAARALRQLDDSGLARPLTAGVWRGKRATEWRLTFWRCDKTGELPVSNWKPACVASRPVKVAPQPHSPPLRRTHATQAAKNSMSEVPDCGCSATLIDIPGGRELAGEVTTDPISDPPDSSKPILAFSADKKPWRKPQILSDEPRDFDEFPLEQQRGAA